MKQITRTFTITLTAFLLLAGFGAAALGAQDSEKIAVPLSDPSKPARVEANLVMGSMMGTIRVEAYDGAEVLVEVETEMREVTRGESERRDGLRVIPNTSAGLTVEEEDNEVEISAESWNSSVNLSIKVPRRTSLALATLNGDIEVRGVEGEHELSNVNGGIEATGIRGSVVANTVNGPLTVSFDAVTAGKAMSFSNLNGTIEITFPPDLAADLRMRSDQGEILTDFDFEAQPTTRRVQEGGEDGGFRLKIEKEVHAQVNGGGPEIVFKNFNGDILIRKGG